MKELHDLSQKLASSGIPFYAPEHHLELLRHMLDYYSTVDPEHIYLGNVIETGKYLNQLYIYTSADPSGWPRRGRLAEPISQAIGLTAAITFSVERNKKDENLYLLLSEFCKSIGQILYALQRESKKIVSGVYSGIFEAIIARNPNISFGQAISLWEDALRMFSAKIPLGFQPGLANMKPDGSIEIILLPLSPNDRRVIELRLPGDPTVDAPPPPTNPSLEKPKKDKKTKGK